MEQNEIFREMALTCLITNFSQEGGFEKIWLSTGRKTRTLASNRFRQPAEEEKDIRNSWNGRQVSALT